LSDVYAQPVLKTCNLSMTLSHVAENWLERIIVAFDAIANIGRRRRHGYNVVVFCGPLGLL
jgi:hypothetical protein